MGLPSERRNVYHLSHYSNAIDIKNIGAVVVVYTENNKPTTMLEGVTYLADSVTEGEAFDLWQRIRTGKHLKKEVVNFRRRNIGLKKGERNNKLNYKVAAHIYISHEDAKIIGGRMRVNERVRNYTQSFLFGIGKASYSIFEGADGLAQKQIENKIYESSN